MRLHRIIWKKINHLSGHALNRKIGFVVAGTIKGGTTTLYNYLRAHPQIGMSRIKETHFFNDDKFFSGSTPRYDQYHQQFADVWLCKIMGEATPDYLSAPSTPRRLYEYNSRMKIVISLRDPVSRAFSHWNMFRQKREELRTFGTAIREELSINRRDEHGYVRCGFYSEQIERFRQFFPKEQMLIFKSDELRNNPQEIVNRIFHFVGVAGKENIPVIEIHKRSYEETMNENDRKFLQEIYRPEIKKLEQLLSWDCSRWLGD